MTQLFIRLYLDEDVSALVAKLVRSRGFEILTATEVGNRGISDAQQLAFAIERGLTIVTHNRFDFERLAQDYIKKKLDHAGIIIAVRRTAPEVARRLLKIMDQFTADEMVNQLLYI